MIELQTLVGELTIAEFTKLCGSIGMMFFLFGFSAFIIAHLIYGIIGDFINFLRKFKECRKKEKQDN